MPEVPDEHHAQALADITYIARSENRVTILKTLESGAATRRELEETTGIARATVGRTLADFEDRGWAERLSEGAYAVTPTGKRVVAAFVPFVETMAAIRTLGDTVVWLPTDQVPIDLQEFREATVRRAEQADPLALATYATELLETAAEFRCLVGVAPPLAFERTLRDRVTAGELTTTHVITAEELNYLRGFPERVERWQEYVAAGGNVYCYDGAVPCSLLVFDDTVLIGRSPSDGRTSEAFIESRSKEIHSWAHEVVDQYRQEAKPLGGDAFVVSDGATE